MITVITIVLAVVLGYLIGAIPFGVIIVKLKTGQDVRQIGSGRTGGTNVGRAAGAGAGYLTAILDGLKVTAAIFLAGQLTGGDHLAEALAGVAGVLGHNKSIFLMRRVLAKDGRTRIQINGGAGGAPAVGGAFGLWPWSLAFVLTGGLFFWLVVGYASLGTLAVGLVTITVFLIRAIFFNGPWEYVVYGVLCLVLQVWALRPNIRRLIEGTERAHGGWAKRRAERLGAQENQSE